MLPARGWPEIVSVSEGGGWREQAASRGQETNGKGVLSEVVLQGSKGNKKTAFQGACDLISVFPKGASPMQQGGCKRLNWWHHGAKLQLCNQQGSLTLLHSQLLTSSSWHLPPGPHPSVAVKIQRRCFAKTKAPVSLDLGERTWLFPSHSQGKGLPQHRCGLHRMAQHEKEHCICVRQEIQTTAEPGCVTAHTSKYKN